MTSLCSLSFRARNLCGLLPKQRSFSVSTLFGDFTAEESSVDSVNLQPAEMGKVRGGNCENRFTGDRPHRNSDRNSDRYRNSGNSRKHTQHSRAETREQIEHRGENPFFSRKDRKVRKSTFSPAKKCVENRRKSLGDRRKSFSLSGPGGFFPESEEAEAAEGHSHQSPVLKELYTVQRQQNRPKSLNFSSQHPVSREKLLSIPWLPGRDIPFLVERMANDSANISPESRHWSAIEKRIAEGIGGSGGSAKNFFTPRTTIQILISLETAAERYEQRRKEITLGNLNLGKEKSSSEEGQFGVRSSAPFFRLYFETCPALLKEQLPRLVLQNMDGKKRLRAVTVQSGSGSGSESECESNGLTARKKALEREKQAVARDLVDFHGLFLRRRESSAFFSTNNWSDWHYELNLLRTQILRHQCYFSEIQRAYLLRDPGNNFLYFSFHNSSSQEERFPSEELLQLLRRLFLVQNSLRLSSLNGVSLFLDVLADLCEQISSRERPAASSASSASSCSSFGSSGSEPGSENILDEVLVTGFVEKPGLEATKKRSKYGRTAQNDDVSHWEICT